MPLQPEDLQQITEHVKAHLSEWLTEQSIEAPPVPDGINLGEKLLRIEEELKHQRELIREGFRLMEQRFEAVDRRFEAVDERFVAMDERFVAMDKRFVTMDKRFVVMDKRFEAMDKRFEAIITELREMNQHSADLKHWVQVNVGGLQRRAGRKLEDTIAGTLRFAMGLDDLSPDQLELRKKVEDREGLIGPKGRSYEYDLLLVNGEAIVFEIKSVPEVEDVQRFADKARLIESVLDRPIIRRVMVSLDKPSDIVMACEDEGIVLV